MFRLGWGTAGLFHMICVSMFLPNTNKSILGLSLDCSGNSYILVLKELLVIAYQLGSVSLRNYEVTNWMIGSWSDARRDYRHHLIGYCQLDHQFHWHTLLQVSTPNENSVLQGLISLEPWFEITLFLRLAPKDLLVLTQRNGRSRSRSRAGWGTDEARSTMR